MACDICGNWAMGRGIDWIGEHHEQCPKVKALRDVLSRLREVVVDRRYMVPAEPLEQNGADLNDDGTVTLAGRFDAETLRRIASAIDSPCPSSPRSPGSTPPE